MKSLRASVAFAILAFLAASAYGQDSPAITLRRTACYGWCPIYSVEIFDDGRVLYNGERFVSAIGPHEAQISRQAVATLIDEFVKVDYFSLKDEYEVRENPDGTFEMITDQSTTFTSLRFESQSKTIRDYAVAPVSLKNLEMEIDRVANTHRWIHGDDDLKMSDTVGMDVYSAIKPGFTPLMQAAGSGDMEMLAAKRAAGFDINARDETGWTALMVAAVQCHENTVRQLLYWGADVRARDRRGDDALMGASSALCSPSDSRIEQANIVHLLIARGADPNVRDDAGITPLIAVTKYGNVESAKALIAAGADAKKADKDGHTALDRAREALENNRDSYFVEEAQQLVQILEQLDKLP